MSDLPTFSDILTAEKRIRPYIQRTPVFTSRQVNRKAGCKVYFKCEPFQRAGAFKFRGACNAIFSLSDEEAERGVVAHSSGNHAQAVSLAASLRGINAHVVMPENAPAVKIAGVRSYGANLTFCKPTQQSREETAAAISEKTGAIPVHPYNQHETIAGQGTAALELMKEIPDLDFIVTPVGGGGMLSGAAITANQMNEKCRSFGVEPEGSDAARRSLEADSLIRVDQPETIAEGLRASLGDLTFAVIRRYADQVVTVPDSSIVRDMRYIWERMKVLTEPSSAVVVSALFDQKIDCSGKKVGVILTGGNVDLDSLPWLR